MNTFALDEILGIPVIADRKPVIERKLQSLADDNGFGSIASLLEKCNRSLEATSLKSQVIHFVTAHETQFFRFPSLIEYLQEYVLRKSEDLTLLSAGCSTGKEAFSIAGWLTQHQISQFEMDGVDVDLVSVKKAAAGEYSDVPFSLYSVTEQLPGGIRRFNDDVINRVNFFTDNLFKPNFIRYRSYDLITCFKVLIYYDTPDRLVIIHNLMLLLKEDGRLLVNCIDINKEDIPDTIKSTLVDDLLILEMA